MYDLDLELNKGLITAAKVHKTKEHKVLESFLERLGLTDFDEETVDYSYETFTGIAEEDENDDLHDYRDVVNSIEETLDSALTNQNSFEVISGLDELNDLVALKFKVSIVLERQEKEAQISKLSIERDAGIAAGQDTTVIEGKIADLEASMQ